MAINQKNIMDENRFWLQILGDHSRFILSSLSPSEKEEIQRANAFISLFDSLLSQAQAQFPEEKLTKEALSAAEEIRAFKLHLIKRHLAEKIEFDLPPDFLNHMVNEVEEYIYILKLILENKADALLFHPVHLHILWMLDGSGHAQTIVDRLCGNCKQARETAQKFAAKFSNEHQKALEMRGFLRTGLVNFPALNKMNTTADYEMKNFMKYLENTESEVRSKKILGTLSPLMLNHMFREECYYLSKLSEVGNTKKPDCDPASPRRE